MKIVFERTGEATKELVELFSHKNVNIYADDNSYRLEGVIVGTTSTGVNLTFAIGDDEIVNYTFVKYGIINSIEEVV